MVSCPSYLFCLCPVRRLKAIGSAATKTERTSELISCGSFYLFSYKISRVLYGNSLFVMRRLPDKRRKSVYKKTPRLRPRRRVVRGLGALPYGFGAVAPCGVIHNSTDS